MVVVVVPLLAAVALALVAHRAAAAWLNLAAAGVTFALACGLPWQFDARRLLLIDAPAAHMAMLAAFVALAMAWASTRRDAEPAGRFAFALFQALLGATLFAVLANGPEGTWICIEASVIVAAVAIGLKLTPAAVAEAWRFLVLCGTGLALALFGIVALSVGGNLLNVGTVLLVLGYGTIAALAPAPMQLAPLLAILRVRGMAPAPLLVTVGLAALLFAAVCLGRQDGRRRVAVAWIGQTGVVLFAFGLGSTAAAFAGLLHLTLLTLTRTALEQGAGRRAAVVAMAGLPPFGLFASFFLIVMAAIGTVPWLVVPLGVLFVAFAWALMARPIEPNAGATEAIALAPAWLLLGVTVVLGIAMPPPVVAWFTTVAAGLR